MVITAHWIDNSWNLRQCLLQFDRFLTPHTADTPCSFIMDELNSCDLMRAVQCNTAENATDMVTVIWKFTELLKYTSADVYCDALLYRRCVAHVINVSVRNSTLVLCEHVHSDRSLVSLLRSSPKWRKFFETVSIKSKPNCLVWMSRPNVFQCLGCWSRPTVSYDYLQRLSNVYQSCRKRLLLIYNGQLWAHFVNSCSSQLPSPCVNRASLLTLSLTKKPYNNVLSNHTAHAGGGGDVL